jgi:hypothetical protein
MVVVANSPPTEIKVRQRRHQTLPRRLAARTTADMTWPQTASAGLIGKT